MPKLAATKKEPVRLPTAPEEVPSIDAPDGSPEALGSTTEPQDEATADTDMLDYDDDLGFVTLDSTEDKINALYYGAEGTGKTTAIAAMTNLPGNGKVLIVNIEGGLKKKALVKRGIDTSQIVVWPKPGVRTTKALLDKLYLKLRADLADNPDSWKGVAFDSVTELATVFREDATTKRQDNLDRTGRQYDPDFIDVADWGVQSDHMKKVLRQFRDLPCHFAATALERVDENLNSGPDVNPAVANALLGYVDFVLYCKATQATADSPVEDEVPAEFRAATRPGRKYRAKDRFDVLPRVLATPTFDRIAGYVAGDLTEEDDVLQADYLQRKAERDEKIANEKAEREARKTAARRTTAK